MLRCQTGHNLAGCETLTRIKKLLEKDTPWSEIIHQTMPHLKPVRKSTQGKNIRGVDIGEDMVILWSDIFKEVRPCCLLAMKSDMKFNADLALYDVDVVEGAATSAIDLDRYEKEELAADILMSLKPSSGLSLTSPLIADFMSASDQELREFRKTHDLTPVRELSESDKNMLQTMIAIESGRELDQIWAAIKRAKLKEAKFRNMRIIRGVPELESLKKINPAVSRPFVIHSQSFSSEAASSEAVEDVTGPEAPISFFESESEVATPKPPTQELKFDECSGILIPQGVQISMYVNVGNVGVGEKAKYIVPVLTRVMPGVQGNRLTLSSD